MAIVKKYRAEIISISNPVQDIFTVEINSLSGRFKYLPGQFLHLALDKYDPSYGWPDSRCFSIQSSPDQESIKMTYSVKGKFTKRMSEELKIGSIIDIKLPYGNLFQQNYSKENVVFIAGGTGITPFLSLFTDSTFVKYKIPILYFGLRTKEFNVYEHELNRALEINSELKIFMSYQDINGFLNVEKIITEYSSEKTYFISGPRAMITSFRDQLRMYGINDELIRTDDWE